MSTFVDRLAAASESTHSLVCVGLDPDPALMAVPDVVDFNQSIVDATSDLVCAYKPNLAFYEAQGPRGFEALAKTISHIQSVAPTAIIIGDAKRGDVSSTNVAYARALFDVWGFDAATINGYAGGESLEPFFDYENKGVFVWCRSSNPGAKEFQDLSISRGPARGADGIPLYQCMAERAAGWNSRGNVGLVVGSTYPDELGAVRARCPGMPILVPGVGTQGGELASSVKLGLDSKVHNVLISSSRGIIYASGDKKDFAEAARNAARNLRNQINSILTAEGRNW